jgi:hypothetical protein
LFEFKPAIPGFSTLRYGSKSLNRFKNTLRQMPFFAQNRLDDPGAVRFAKPLVFEERLSILIIAGDDGLSCRLYAGDEAFGA